MEMTAFPTINLEATGKHIAQLREERGLTVRDLQQYFGFKAPQAIYKWQSGAALPSVDNLLGLSQLLGVSINAILITTPLNTSIPTDHEPEGSVFLFKNRRFTGRKSRFMQKAAGTKVAAVAAAELYGIAQSVSRIKCFFRMWYAVRISKHGNRKPR